MNTRQKLIFLPISGLTFAFFSLFSREKQVTVCQSNLKQINNGLLIYVRDYDDKLPPAARWETVLEPYTKNSSLYRCPAGFNYAFNRHLSGVTDVVITSVTSTPTFFDSNSTPTNSNDFGTSYIASGAHWRYLNKRGSNVVFYDGHVKWLQQKPTFQALKPLSTPLPPFVIQERPVKRDSKGRVIVKIEATKPR